MGKVLGTFLLLMFINVILFMVLGSFFMSDIQYETPIYTFSTIIIILLTILISILVYIISLLKEKL
ncbi:hypothetical protein ACFSCX_19130 [Bacillus salitolerans]|uniref:Uncharacterized protein n=1 Tax=Bacillus salitolerans TaxID=1437434 RepID=A0ABW4LU39_9BACI